MSDRRLSVAPLIATVLALTIGASAAFGGPLTFLRIGTGPTSGSMFPLGGLLGGIISNPPGSRDCERGGSCGVPGVIVTATSSEGSIENIREVEAGNYDLAIVHGDVAFWAYYGLGPFTKQEPVRTLRAIGALFPQAVHLIVPEDSDIRDLPDLRGKRVAVGEDGSGGAAMVQIILSSRDMSEDDIEEQRLEPGTAADALVSGDIDAAFFVTGYPDASIETLASRLPVRFVPLAWDDYDDIITRHSFITGGVIPANSYPGIPATLTLNVSAQLIVRENLDEKLVYGITRALWHETSRKKLEKNHPRGAQIRLKAALKGVGIPLHPGAIKFYQDVGLLKSPF
jgi:TRAP transporter TAXI family solute receptor